MFVRLSCHHETSRASTCVGIGTILAGEKRDICKSHLPHTMLRRSLTPITTPPATLLFSQSAVAAQEMMCSHKSVGKKAVASCIVVVSVS